MKTYVPAHDNRRLLYINGFNAEAINDITSEIGFIKGKGMLMEFALKNYNEGIVEIYDNLGRRKSTRSENPSIYFDERWKKFKELEYDGEKYWVGIRNAGLNDLYEIYKELPRIINDDIFHWKENKKYGSREALLVEGDFEYFCIVKENGDASIDIRYTACMNRHSNKVTIATIDVIDASNEDILEAIKKWKTEFKKSLNVA